MSDAIEASASALGATPAGRIRYDRAVTAAQVAGKNILEWSSAGAAEDIITLWKSTVSLINADGECKHAS
jgi:hypothetical protein